MAGLLQARGILSQADLGILLVYCDAYSRLVAARAELARDGLIVSTAVGAAKLNPAATAAAVAARELRTAAAELGATPTARARVPAAEPPRDDLEEFLAGGPAPPDVHSCRSGDRRKRWPDAPCSKTRATMR